jgi:hypothetical protein
MHSLRDVAHDGWLCTFNTKQQLEITSANSWAAPVQTTGTVRKRQAVRPVHHLQNHTCWALSSSQPGGPPCWTSPLAFGLIGRKCSGSVGKCFRIYKFKIGGWGGLVLYWTHDLSLLNLVNLQKTVLPNNPFCALCYIVFAKSVKTLVDKIATEYFFYNTGVLQNSSGFLALWQ